MRFTIMLAQESTLIAEPELHEAGVPDHESLQPQQLFQIEPLTASLSDCPPPSLNAVLLRPLSFDRVTRL